MFKINNMVGKKSIEKEVKKMKKLIAIATVVLFMFGTATPAGAALPDVTRVLFAEADLMTGVSELKSMPMPHLMDKTTGNDLGAVSATNQIKWTYVAGKVWKAADQYIMIAYEANVPGWGIQIFTHNTNTDIPANPKWVEKPANLLNPDKPAGLVGTDATYLAVPVAWKAFPGGNSGKPQYSDGSGFNETTDYKKYYTEPKEQEFGDPSADDDVHYIELYQYKKVTGSKVDLYGKYCWMIDKKEQKWDDQATGDPAKNNNGKIDEGEVVDAFSNKADINTVVNYLGCSTCTFDSTGSFIWRNACTSPVYVVFAAKLAKATIRTKYKTNSLYLHLYNE